MRVAFGTYVERKTHEAEAARIERLTTIVESVDRPAGPSIGNPWSRLHYGGGFDLVAPMPGQTAVTLVFVQTKDGNTGGPDPGAFGGGATDKHLLYEGLTRVAADGVLSGAGSVHPEAFFSVWHPELVALRLSLGLPRHPTQIVVSKRGRLNLDARVFSVPDVPVVLIAGDEGVARHAAALRARPWIRIVRANDSSDLRGVLDELRTGHGIRRISAIGGRATATALVDSGLVQDICLTTTPQNGGAPDTPWYAGARPPRMRVMTEKAWYENGSRLLFDHMSIAPRPANG